MTEVLAISGSLRAGSTNSAALRTIAGLAPDGVHVTIFDGMRELPHFDPDLDAEGLEPHPAVAALRAAIARADALLLCTPEYAGALPGVFKELLEWTVGGGEIYGKPVMWINVSGVAAPTGGADAHDSLRKVLGYVGAEIVEPARVPLSRADVGDDGLIADTEIRAALATALRALAESA